MAESTHRDCNKDYTGRIGQIKAMILYHVYDYAVGYPVVDMWLALIMLF